MYQLFASVLVLTMLSISCGAKSAQTNAADLGLGITSEDVERYIVATIPEERLKDVLNDENLIFDIVQNLAIIRALAAEARRNASVDQVQAKWAASLASDRSYMEFLKRDIEASAFSAPVSDTIVREQYLAFPERFTIPEQISASHILISITRAQRETALQEAQAIRVRAINGDVSFDTLAIDNSDDPSVVTNSGNLGWFPRGAMEPAFEEAAFALEQPGDVSDVIETRHGFHIIKLNGRKPPVVREFDEVKAGLVMEMQAQAAKRAWVEYIAKIRAEASASIDKNAVSELEERLRAEQ